MEIDLEDSSAGLREYLERDPDLTCADPEYCSEHSASFHFVNAALMYEIDAFLHRCPRSAIDAFYAEKGRDYFRKGNDTKLLFK